MNGELLTQTALAKKATAWRSQNLKIVLTNGCYDLLHVGHLRSFITAKKLGDLLVVGINSDHSVTALKGPTRPLISARDRAELLAALEPVDYVTIFDDPTASHLLELVHPHIYVKGGDYTLESLPEKKTLLDLNIKVKFFPLVFGISTSELIKKIRSANI